MKKQVKKIKLFLITITFVVAAFGFFLLGKLTTKNSLGQKNQLNNPYQQNFSFKPNSPTNQNELKFTTSYLCELDKSYMYKIEDSDRCIVIDKKNLVFSNKLIKDLTNKDNRYIFGFSPEKAEKYHNQSSVYYFSESNNDFGVMIKVLNPQPGIRSEWKFRYVGCNDGEWEGNSYLIFDNFSAFPEVSDEDLKCIFINKKHPELKKILKGKEIERGKNFIIRFGKPNVINKAGKELFDEFNENLEIREA